jgi:anti-anti-sigma regulatory factor
MSIDYRVSQVGEDTLSVSVVGELGPNLGARSLIEALVSTIDEPEVRHVDINLSEITWLTLEGIGALVGLKQYVDGTGRTLRVVEPTQQAAAAIERAGLTTWFET